MFPETIERLRTPVWQVFSYGIRHVFMGISDPQIRNIFKIVTYGFKISMDFYTDLTFETRKQNPNLKKITNQPSNQTLTTYIVFQNVN